MTASGRPRSEAARTAVLHAVDDMLVEEGYAAMTMKGIAERAGVGRQTVYRWWSNKAEILLEAVVMDAAKKLVVEPAATTLQDVTNFLDSVAGFLTLSDEGAAYRALVGEAQHDRAVAELISGSDVLVASALPVLERAVERGEIPADLALEQAAARLVGPLFFRVMTGADDGLGDHSDEAAQFLREYEPI